MATQFVQFSTAFTPTGGRLLALADGAEVADSSTVAAWGDADGYFTVAFTDEAAGWYEFEAYDADGPLVSGFVLLVLASGTYRVVDRVDVGTIQADAINAAAIASGALDGKGDWAVEGDEMDFVDAPNGTAVSAIQNGLATATVVNEMSSNLGSSASLEYSSANLSEAVGWLQTQLGLAPTPGTFGDAVGDIKAKTDNLPASPAATGDIPTAIQNADAILSRSVANVETTAPEHSLATAILALLEWSVSGGTLTIKRSDGTTTHFTKTITSNTSDGTVITGAT